MIIIPRTSPEGIFFEIRPDCSRDFRLRHGGAVSVKKKNVDLSFFSMPERNIARIRMTISAFRPDSVVGIQQKCCPGWERKLLSRSPFVNIFRNHPEFPGKIIIDPVMGKLETLCPGIRFGSFRWTCKKRSLRRIGFSLPVRSRHILQNRQRLNPASH